MKLVEFLIKEITSYKKFEVILLSYVFLVILFNLFYVHDSIFAIISAIFGILYTINAGKCKTICYYYGLIGSFAYAYLSYLNHFWGNLGLYALYYIPMQILGIFLWRKNLNKDTNLAIKEKLDLKGRIFLFIISLIGISFLIAILFYLNDKNPVCDGITTFLSIVGMYLTVKRKFEQWVVWILVNGISFIMWLYAVFSHSRTYSTVVMWGVYFVLSIYFFYEWKKELKNN